MSTASARDIARIVAAAAAAAKPPPMPGVSTSTRPPRQVLPAEPAGLRDRLVQQVQDLLAADHRAWVTHGATSRSWTLVPPPRGADVQDLGGVSPAPRLTRAPSRARGGPSRRRRRYRPAGASRRARRRSRRPA